MSLAVMDDWVTYVFQTAGDMLGDEGNGDIGSSASFGDIQAFCAGRVHNIWGSERNEDNPTLFLQHDIVDWQRSPMSMPLSQFRFGTPVLYEFGFSNAKKEEMAALIQRYGTTTTGIGRIIVQMGRNRIWREPVALSGPNGSQITTRGLPAPCLG
jgi:hypothetical protein